MKLIYLIKAVFDGQQYYKIGITSRTAEKRLKELQTGNALKLEIVDTFNTKFGNLFEKTLHRTFTNENSIGEWFLLTNEQVIDFLTICNRVESNLECISQDSTYWEQKKGKII